MATFATGTVGWNFWHRKPAQPAIKKANIEIINIDGALVDTKKLQMSIWEAIRNTNTDGIILSINSPGGTVLASGALESVIRSAKQIKPVVAFVSGGAFSGGYMAVSAADIIICPTISMVGSIGIILQIEKHKKIKKNSDYKCDVEIEIISTSELKGALNPNVPLTEESRENIKNEINDSYNLFCEIVARNRGLKLEEKEKWAASKCFFTKNALELGLIDKEGSIADCEEEIVKLLRNRNPNIQYANEINIIQR